MNETFDTTASRQAHQGYKCSDYKQVKEQLERTQEELRKARNEIARLNGQTNFACECGGVNVLAHEWREMACELAKLVQYTQGSCNPAVNRVLDRFAAMEKGTK